MKNNVEKNIYINIMPSHTHLIEYIKLKYPVLYKILKQLVFLKYIDNNRTIIIPVKAELEKIQKLIDKEEYSAATQLIKPYIIMGSYPNGDAFTENKAKNMCGNTLIIKSKKAKEVEVTSGTMKVASDYFPSVSSDPASCEFTNRSCVWIMETGTIPYNTPVFEEVKIKQKGSDEPPVTIISRDALHDFIKSNCSRSHFVVTEFTRILYVLANNPEYRYYYILFRCLYTGDIISDIFILFNTPGLFPPSIMQQLKNTIETSAVQFQGLPYDYYSSYNTSPLESERCLLLTDRNILLDKQETIAKMTPTDVTAITVLGDINNNILQNKYIDTDVQLFPLEVYNKLVKDKTISIVFLIYEVIFLYIIESPKNKANPYLFWINKFNTFYGNRFSNYERQSVFSQKNITIVNELFKTRAFRIHTFVFIVLSYFMQFKNKSVVEKYDEFFNLKQGQS